jgi:transketolase
MSREAILAAVARRALLIRLGALRSVRHSGYGFLGSCFSVADVLAAVHEFFAEREAREGTRNHLILSKGHSAPALYALASAGSSNRAAEAYAELGSPFQGHPNQRLNPLVAGSTGSVGNGLAIGLGIALGLRIQGLGGLVCVVVGDGELQAGLFWESYLQLSTSELAGVLLIVDENGWQSNGEVRTNGVARGMLRAGLTCADVDGHDHAALLDALAAFAASRRSSVIIARTRRGAGSPLLERTPAPMSWIPPQDELGRMIAELETGLARFTLAGCPVS